MAPVPQTDLRESDTSLRTARDETANTRSTVAVAPAELTMQSYGHTKMSPAVLEGLIFLIEFIIIGGIGIATYVLAVPSVNDSRVSPLVAIPVITGLAMLIQQSLKAFQLATIRSLRRSWTLVLIAWASIIGLSCVVGGLIVTDPIDILRWIGSWMLFGLPCLLAERWALFIMTHRLMRAGRLARRAAIVGTGTAAIQLLADLAENGGEDLTIVGVFDDRTDERAPSVVAGYPNLGTVDDLVDFARHTELDLVIIALPMTAEERLLSILRKLWVLPMDIRLAALMNKLRFLPRVYSTIGNVPVIDVFDKPIADWDFVIKAVFDRVVGSMCLALMAPIMVAVAVAVKLDSPGPVLFRQIRYGFNNKRITVYKFRSMYANQADMNATRLVTRGDPRVTPVGRFIRKTSLDELPQLFNVVFEGNLSLVGPRPHALQAKAANRLYEDVVDCYFARHRVRPGITGWAQINDCRGETDTPEQIQKRVDCDLYYIENWSIFFDIYVLLITPWALLTTKNAM